MKKSDVIKWYNENTDAELNEFFLDRMIKLGIIKEDIDLLTKRPEQLSVEEFIRLTEWLNNA